MTLPPELRRLGATINGNVVEVVVHGVETKTNCPTCGRLVPSFFEHVDTDCSQWPDKGDSLPLMYRGYHIGHSLYYGFDYIHDDYDEGDSRHGNESTIEGCYRAIDEAEDD